jgi:hypothetical protein
MAPVRDAGHRNNSVRPMIQTRDRHPLPARTMRHGMGFIQRAYDLQCSVPASLSSISAVPSPTRTSAPRISWFLGPFWGDPRRRGHRRYRSRQQKAAPRDAAPVGRAMCALLTLRPSSRPAVRMGATDDRRRTVTRSVLKWFRKGTTNGPSRRRPKLGGKNRTDGSRPLSQRLGLTRVNSSLRSPGRL